MRKETIDLISEQVEELRKMAEWLEAACLPEGTELANKAADTIEFLSAKLQTVNMGQLAEDCDGWIACKDRLPEDDTCVLAQVNGKYKNITLENAFEFATYIKGEGWILEVYPDWYNPGVVAWRELPEPYHEP